MQEDIINGSDYAEGRALWKVGMMQKYGIIEGRGDVEIRTL